MAGKGSIARAVKKFVYDANFDNIKKNPEINKGFKTMKVFGKLVQRKIYK